MRPLNQSVMFVFLLLLHSSRAGAEQPQSQSGMADNAALQYWKAFSLVPVLDKDQEKLLADWSQVPLDDAAVKLVESSRPSIEFLRRGAKLPRCDWGLDYRDGVSLLLPHLAKARDLARLAALHARLEFQRGHREIGLENAAAIFVLARHVADPIMLCVLVSYHIEGMAIVVLAAELPQLGDSVNTLKARLESLPKGASLPQAILNEKMHMDGWMLRKLREVEAAKPGLWRGLWKSFFDGCEDSEDKRRALAVDSFDQAIQLLENICPVYDQWAGLVILPKRDFDARYPELLKQARAANPLAGLLLPTSDTVVAAQYRNQAQIGMLKAGIDIVHGGVEKPSVDPFGEGQPWGYRKLDQGFELRSKLLYRGQPVTLTVGRGNAK